MSAQKHTPGPFKTIAEVQPGDSFLDSFGLAIHVTRVGETRDLGIPRCPATKRLYFRTDSAHGKELYMSFPLAQCVRTIAKAEGRS